MVMLPYKEANRNFSWFVAVAAVFRFMIHTAVPGILDKNYICWERVSLHKIIRKWEASKHPVSLWILILAKYSKNEMEMFMVFDMKGVGGSRVPLTFFQFFLPSRITPWLPKRVLHIVWALHYVFIVVKVTLNIAEYGSRRSHELSRQQISILNLL